MKTLKQFIILGTIYVLIIGTLSHFVYDWSKENVILGFFFPVSESTWEHMKLVFFPMLVYALFMNQRLKAAYPCIVPASFAGILLGTWLIPVLFYTYSGILGTNYAILDISTFVISVIVAFIVIYKLTVSCKASPYLLLLKIAVYAMIVGFVVFTYLPLNIGIMSRPPKL